MSLKVNLEIMLVVFKMNFQGECMYSLECFQHKYHVPRISENEIDVWFILNDFCNDEPSCFSEIYQHFQKALHVTRRHNIVVCFKWAVDDKQKNILNKKICYTLS